MENLDFKKWPKIEQLVKCQLVITQKINGTNGQIEVMDSGALRIGSRTRYLGPGSDNFNFWSWCMDRKEKIAQSLGIGRHYGEFCGPGIQSGEGLTERTFVLFDHHRHTGKELPEGFRCVPVLFDGVVKDIGWAINDSLARLKLHGSQLVPGFMHPEGIMAQIGGARYKHVFEPEETAWERPDAEYRANKDRQRNALYESLKHLLQPIRLGKILSMDSQLITDYPKTIPEIVNRYTADLLAEYTEYRPADMSGDELKYFRTLLHKLVRDTIKSSKK